MGVYFAPQKALNRSVRSTLKHGGAGGWSPMSCSDGHFFVTHRYDLQRCGVCFNTLLSSSLLVVCAVCLGSSRLVLSGLVLLCSLLSCHVSPSPADLRMCYLTCCLVISGPVLPCVSGQSCLSCLVVPCLVLSCPVRCCTVLPSPVLDCSHCSMALLLLAQHCLATAIAKEDL